MLQLVYVSSATTHFSKAELLELLTKSRTKNSALGITGMLLYKDGNFMQMLEGEDDPVRQLFETIVKDPRHHNSIVLIDELAETAFFADWSMGFRDLRHCNKINLSFSVDSAMFTAWIMLQSKSASKN
jgi:hypothetical protein